EQHGDNSGEDSEDEEHNEGDQDETEENEDDGDEQDDEQPVLQVIPPKKRKRAVQGTLPPAKKVTFAPSKANKAKTKPRTAKSATDRKSANIPSAASKKDVKLGDGAYDFGKFF